MIPTVRLAAALAHRLRRLRGTQDSFTVDVGGLFYQAASYQGDAVLIELAGDEFLPDQRRLTSAQHDHLLRLGFTRPTRDLPNWWIGVEDGRDRGLVAAARAVITALVEAHGVSIDELTEELPLYRYSSHPPRTPHVPPVATEGEGEPLAVETTYGAVLLYPNRYATLNGAPWAEEPVREWTRLGDGRLSVQMAVPAGDDFPNLGFVADKEVNVAVLRGFLPSRDDISRLALRLAVAEQYALTCIATGTLYHEGLFRASLELEQTEGSVRASDVVGWDETPRLEAAVEAVMAFYWSHSADTNRELHDDQLLVWEAIQRWVRLSPWIDDLDFDIIPNDNSVTIQRTY